MTAPKTTLRKQRLQSMLDPNDYIRVVKLAEQEQRSESHMGAILIKKALDTIDAETAADNTQPKSACA